MWQRVSLGLVLGIIVIVHLLVPVNPDFTLPAVPELVSVALLSGFLCVVLGSGKKLPASEWSFRPSEKFILSLLWLTVVGVTGPRAFWSLFHTPGQVWIPCLSLPGIAVKLECFFQASIFQNYGFRTFFMLLTATTLGTLAYLIARIVNHGWKFLLGAVVFGPLLVTAVGFICVSLGINQALPKVLLSNNLGAVRLTQIFGNPSWVWPYIAPGLAIVLWATVVASAWAWRMLWAGSSVLLILGILATQQRGGLLLCVLYITFCGFYCLTCGLKRRSLPILALGGILLAALGNSLFSLSNHPKLLQNVAQSIGYTWKAEPLSIDPHRLQIWQGAWDIFKQAPLFGHGYASWFQKISEYGQKHNKPLIVFDTAHNLFFQMLAELGLLHTSLILGILILIAFTVFQNSRRLPGGKLLFLLAVSSFFMPTLVQEINFIRPTFYIHAIFWGTLAGLPFHPVPQLSQDASGQFERWLQNNLFLRKVCLTPLISLKWLTAVSVAGILFCLFNFSFGGSAFETRITQLSPIGRWIGTGANFAAFATAEDKAYSIYSAATYQRPMRVDFGNNVDSPVSVDGNDELYLALENGGQYWPRRHHLSVSPAHPDGGTRWVSLLTFHPPQQSNLGISWSRGMYPWADVLGHAGRWCNQKCIFLANSCKRHDSLDFAVGAPRPDYSETNPLSFQLFVYSLEKGTEFSSALLQNLPKPIAQVQAQLEKPGEEKRFHFEGTPQTGRYLVIVQTASIFNPKAQGFSPDDRDLTVVISETDC